MVTIPTFVPVTDTEHDPDERIHEEEENVTAPPLELDWVNATVPVGEPPDVTSAEQVLLVVLICSLPPPLQERLTYEVYL